MVTYRAPGNYPDGQGGEQWSLTERLVTTQMVKVENSGHRAPGNYPDGQGGEQWSLRERLVTTQMVKVENSGHLESAW